MNKNQCSLCDEDYSIEKRVPKVLKCGHTFCSLCLSEYVAFALACPTCETTVDEEPINLPTNYALLNPETTKDSKNLKVPNKTLMKLNVDVKCDHVSRNINVMAPMYDKLKDLAKSLKDTEEEGAGNFEEMEESLGRMDLELYSCFKPEITPTIKLGNSSTKEEFIRKILVELLKKKNLYAFQLEWYNHSVYWGKLSYKDGKLLIHAFTVDQPPYPSLFVPFRDLKKCMSIDNLQTFIDICGVHLVCNLLTSSEETKKFIKLCTGEEGQSLTGLKSKMTMHHHLNHGEIEISFPERNIEEHDYEFLQSLPSETNETFENVLQIKMCKDKCKIVNNPNYLSSVETMAGEVVVASTKSQVFEDLLENAVSVHDGGVSLLLPISQSSSKKTVSTV